MKQLLLAATLLFFPAWAARALSDSATPPPAAKLSANECTLRIHATGFRNQKGFAGAALFTSPDGWPEREDKSFAHDGFPISGDQATLTFNVPPGRYGVVVLHDQNENHKLDRDFLGIPTEGFGFANNPRVFLVAPPFAQASVNVNCPVTEINVKMIYK